jgi:hypothetical protein
MKFVLQKVKYSDTRKSEQHQQEDLLTDGTDERLQHVGLGRQLAVLNINNQVFYVQVHKFVSPSIRR